MGRPLKMIFSSIRGFRGPFHGIVNFTLSIRALLYSIHEA